VIAVALPVALYLRTLAPTIGEDDSAEFATVSATFGTAHSPGYPLYTLLARAVWYLPIGNPAFRVNLLSAVFAAIALAVTYAIISRLSGQRLAALFGTWLLGLSLPFWFYANVAEVYTLDAALFAGTMLFLLRWRDTNSTRDLVIAFALFGLSMTNRTINLLSLPAIMFFIFPDVRQDPRRVLRASLAALPPLALYGLLPLRSAIGGGYRWGSLYRPDGTPVPIDLTNPSNFWWVISSKAFQPMTHAYGVSGFAGEAGTFGHDLWTSLMAPGLVLAVAGAFALASRRTRAFGLVALMVLPQTLFFINYGALDKRTMFLSTYVGLAICAGCGVAYLSDFLQRDLRMRYSAAAVGCFVAVFALVLVQSSYSDVDRSGNTGPRDRSEALLRIAAPGAVVLGDWQELAPLEYVQSVEGQRPDVLLVEAWRLSDTEQQAIVANSLKDGRNAYIFSRYGRDGRFAEYNQTLVGREFGNWIKLSPRLRVTR
jgi:hypothetical protein